MSESVSLVQAIRCSLPESHEWDERETALLDLAERQAADLDRLEADIAEHGVRLDSGRLNSVFSEARQARSGEGRLITQRQKRRGGRHGPADMLGVGAVLSTHRLAALRG